MSQNSSSSTLTSSDVGSYVLSEGENLILMGGLAFIYLFICNDMKGESYEKLLSCESILVSRSAILARTLKPAEISDAVWTQTFDLSVPQAASI